MIVMSKPEDDLAPDSNHGLGSLILSATPRTRRENPISKHPELSGEKSSMMTGLVEKKEETNGPVAEADCFKPQQGNRGV